MTSDNALQMNAEDHEKAFTEVSFLIESFANTIDNIMGGATAPVGRIAGRSMARKIPVHLDESSLEDVLQLLAQRMQAGFDFTVHKKDDAAAEIRFGRCALRDVCKLRNKSEGGAVCKLFHSYFDGIVNELLHRPVKSEIVEAGQTCLIRACSQ